MLLELLELKLKFLLNFCFSSAVSSRVSSSQLLTLNSNHMNRTPSVDAYHGPEDIELDWPTVLIKFSFSKSIGVNE